MKPADLPRLCDCGEPITVEESPRGFHVSCWACRWHKYFRWQSGELVAFDPAAGTVAKPLNRKHRNKPAWGTPISGSKQA